MQEQLEAREETYSNFVIDNLKKEKGKERVELRSRRFYGRCKHDYQNRIKLTDNQLKSWFEIIFKISE